MDRIILFIFSLSLVCSIQAGATLTGDGTDDHFIVADNASLDFSGNTQSICVRHAWTGTAGTDNAVIVARESTSDGNDKWSLRITENDNGHYCIDAGVNEGCGSDGILAGGGAQESVCVVYNGSSADWYVNGVFDTTNSGINHDVDNANFPMYIGIADNTFVTLDIEFEGDIWEVVVIDQLITAGDISIFHNSKIQGIARDLWPENRLAHYLMDEVSDGVDYSTSELLVDISGKGNHATPVNTPTGRENIVTSYP